MNMGVASEEEERLVGGFQYIVDSRHQILPVDGDASRNVLDNTGRLVK